MVDIYKWLFGATGEPGVKAPRDEPDDPPGFPTALMPFHAAIEATRRPIVKLKLTADVPASRTGSRIGGMPWWPKSMAYPTGKAGQPLFLLAQINYADAPTLDGFPSSGLLQFFIGANDLYGCNLDDLLEPDGFVCVYHADPDAAVLLEDDFSFLEIPDDHYMLPLERPHEAVGVRFVADTMTVGPADYRLKQLLPEVAKNSEALERYFDLASPPLVYFGGYANFTQQDPREWQAERDLGDINLLTIDSVNHGKTPPGNVLMWGDCGIAQFFVRQNEMDARDFSRVAYNWDCC